MASVHNAPSMLINKLVDDQKSNNLSDEQERTGILTELKVLCRDAHNARKTWNRSSIEVLCYHAFDNGNTRSSQEAMRCLANAMLLIEDTRQLVIDLDGVYKAAIRMKNDDRNDEFLTARLIFLSTYTGKLNIRRLLDEAALGDSIKRNLYDKIILEQDGTASTPTDIEEMAFEETLKLIPSLVYHCTDCIERLSPSVPHLVKLICTCTTSKTALQSPITHLINALLNLYPPLSKIEDASSREPFFPPENPCLLVNTLISILDANMPPDSSSTTDTVFTPLLTLIRNLYLTAPNQDVKAHIESSLLPDEQSRAHPLGKDNSISSRLVRAAINPSLSHGNMTRDITSSLLYELSHEDSARLVKNIGYGHAVGILMRLGKSIDPSLLQQQNKDGNADQESASVDINPITGQRRDAEEEDHKDDNFVEMTDEEKEREAERLFVLFERLKATGVVDVKNPVEMAIQEGKY